MADDLLADFMGSLLIVGPALVGVIFAFWLYKKARLVWRNSGGPVGHVVPLRLNFVHAFFLKTSFARSERTGARASC